MANQEEKANLFRSLHVPGTPLVLYNVWDAGSARAVASTGASAIGTSSWAVADANGFTDGEKTPLPLAIDNFRRIAAAVELPLTADLESGYGDEPEAVAQTITLALEAGAVGCNLEDSFPKDGSLRAVNDQAERLRHARQAANAAKMPLFINARTDVFFQQPPPQHNLAMLDEAIARAKAYAEAGADGIFVPGLAHLEMIGALVRQSPLPVNIMMGEGSPSISTLAKLGVARVSYGAMPYLAAMKTLKDAIPTG